MYNRVGIKEMLGLTFTSVTEAMEGEKLIFTCDKGKFIFEHRQDCCECVEIEDITGDLQDLVGAPLLLAEEAVSDASNNVSESGTWTFYKFATIKGYVDVRWLGTSNGYYSESVDLSFYPAKVTNEPL